MVNALRPAGALVAGLAAWALCLLVLALLGLGGNVGPHPADLALTPSLPTVTLDAVGSRLGPATDYLEVGNRPLFGRDRRPAPMTADTGTADAPLDVNLTSVLITPGLKLAMVQNTTDGGSRRVRLGDVLDGTSWRLVVLEPRRAVFEGPEGQRELALRVFDGAGGQPPTPQAGAVTGGPVAVPPGATAPDKPDAPAAVAAPGAGAPGSAAATPAVAPVTPDEQVEAIRRRIEARRAMRAAEAAAEQAASEKANR